MAKEVRVAGPGLKGFLRAEQSEAGLAWGCVTDKMRFKLKARL